MSETTFRFRKSYGDAFRKLMTELFGIGIEPGSLRMERNTELDEGDKPSRARFDVVQVKGDEEYILFECKTSEELALIGEAIEQAKQIFAHYMKEKNFATPAVLLRMFEQPNPTSMKLSVQGSFDEEAALLVIPEAANHNTSRPSQRAASSVYAQGGKNPKRVEAGRRAAAKRWSGGVLA